jgi:hypothetical protein
MVVFCETAVVMRDSEGSIGSDRISECCQVRVLTCLNGFLQTNDVRQVSRLV